MTRQEHLDWCKKRAHEYLKAGDTAQAVASMISDLGKHEETAAIGRAMGPMGMMAAMSGDLEEARRFIDGFN